MRKMTISKFIWVTFCLGYNTYKISILDSPSSILFIGFRRRFFPKSLKQITLVSTDIQVMKRNARLPFCKFCDCRQDLCHPLSQSDTSIKLSCFPFLWLNRGIFYFQLAFITLTNQCD